jgi:hypothetical protein
MRGLQQLDMIRYSLPIDLGLNWNLEKTRDVTLFLPRIKSQKVSSFNLLDRTESTLCNLSWGEIVQINIANV